ncbi:MAG: NAD(P)-dependent oxidoreductase, partial [Rhodoferax sp.]|nr:NAD(P)-dependent oxidoreductase [Rhodoferax sp.]
MPVRIGRSPAETASGCEIIITLLPTSLEVHETLHGPTGALQTAAKGAIFIDMSTGSHADFMDLHRELAALDMCLMDCPIARGPDYAAIRKNLFLVGGENKLIDRIHPVLAPICEEVIHC